MRCLIFMTSPLNIDSLGQLFRIFSLIIHVVTCIYVTLIENSNIPKTEFTCIDWPYIKFPSVYWCYLIFMTYPINSNP